MGARGYCGRAITIETRVLRLLAAPASTRSVLSTRTESSEEIHGESLVLRRAFVSPRKFSRIQQPPRRYQFAPSWLSVES